MRHTIARSVVALLAVGALAFQLAASSAIGVAVAGGGFRVDGNLVTGNATVFEGNSLETVSVSSDLELDNGVRMRLGSESRARVYRDRLVLEKGIGELQSGSGYRVEAGGLTLLSEEPGASARVAVSGERRIQAAVLAGSFRVTTATGMVVALMGPGKALDFQLLPQATGAQLPFQMTGCLETREGRYVLRDLVAGVTEELRGDKLDREVGNVVEVTATVIPGAKPVTAAMEVIQVSKLKRVSRGCPAPSAAAPRTAPASQPQPPAPSAETPAPAQPPAPAPPATVKGPGMSGATKAVIAGVLVGGGGAAAAVLLTRKNNKGSVSR